MANKKIVGLTDKEVLESREKYGSNVIKEKPPQTFWQQFVEGFGDPMIRILCIIAVIMVVMWATGNGEWVEPVGTIIAVLLVNFVNAKVGVANDDAYAKLKASQKKETANTIRNGVVTVVEVDDLVVGDVIKLQSGDGILADGVLIDGHLAVDNSALNGEAEECKKMACEEGFKIPDTITGDTFVDKHSLFRNVTVVDGEGYMEVQKVGAETMAGKMAADDDGEEPETPLKLKLRVLADQISKVGYIGGILIAVAALFGYVHTVGGFAEWTSLGFAVCLKQFMQAVSVAISIIVCAVPEGLPLTVALVLMQNTGKMYKNNVMVRKSIGIETAGSMNILFSDKTGTITKGHLEVVNFFNGAGEIVDTTKTDSATAIKGNLNICIGNNTGAMYDSEHRVVGGNMTDRALVSFLGENIYKKVTSDESCAIIEQQDFNSANKFSQSQVANGKTYYKGAPEKLLAKAKKYLANDGTVKDINSAVVTAKMDELAGKAMRVLAFGYSEKPMVRDEINDDLVFIGFVGIRDDVRPEAKAAIEEVQGAGIQVVMITGDRKDTAVAIAKDASLITSEDDVALTSSELADMSDEDIVKILPKLRVVARALPTDKSRMVKICQSQNLVVGMTGDGVNDSPAIKAADVGLAMGSGTAVAKASGDLVILDDNFNSIKNAVWFGRTIYHNILKFCKMQLTINFTATLVAMVCPLFGIEQPLKVTHLLYINLIMDSLASLMFSGEPALKKYMDEEPRKRDEKIINKAMAIQIGFQTAWIFALSMVWFMSGVIRPLFETEAQWYSGYFVFFIFAAMVNAMNIRSDGPNVFEHIRENMRYVHIWLIITLITVLVPLSSYIPGLAVISELFSCEAFGPIGWAAVVLMAITVYPFDLIRKAVTKTA